MGTPVSYLAALPQATRTVLRNVLIAFVALDLFALAAFAVRVDTVSRTTTTPQVVTPPIQVGDPVVLVAPPALSAVPIGTGVPVADAPAVTPADVPDPTPAPKPEDPDPTPLPDGAVEVAECPIPVGSARTNGGLQSLIDFAPAFGPFSAEAFAAASAYQPVLQLIGPILAKYPQFAPTLKPLLTPFLDSFATLLDQGFSLLGPLYSPYRQDFLEAETQLAAALAPYAQKLTASPLGGCLIALQNALLHDGSVPTVAARKG